MTRLQTLLQAFIDAGTIPGAVGLVAKGDQVEVASVGLATVDPAQPMNRDTIFRIASVTKPIVAAAAMMLVDDGILRLEDSIDKWLPELAHLNVVRTPQSALDDVVPAKRSITVEDLLTFRAGYGFPSDFSLPAAQVLFQKGAFLWGRDPDTLPTSDEWLKLVATIPMIAQPGEKWLYNMPSDILGILIARASGESLPEFLKRQLFDPLGMVDTAFLVPAEKRDRFGSFYRRGPGGELSLIDGPNGMWRVEPRLPAGSGGLASTVDNLLAFARLLANGGAFNGQQLIKPESVKQMMTDHLTADQREASTLFLEGQGWGYGASVDVDPANPWIMPGRYGWVGGSGTTWHVVPSDGTVVILLTQMELGGPSTTPLMHEVWQYAYSA